MGAPVPRMGHAPDTDPLHVHWPTEVVLVLRLLLPASLSGRLGSGPAGRFWAVLLPTAVAHVHGENLPAGQALGFALVRHGSPEGAPCCQPSGNTQQGATEPLPMEANPREQND